jgi:sialic acid synthase SpsE
LRGTRSRCDHANAADRAWCLQAAQDAAGQPTDPSKTIAEQSDLLRVVDNERYPAFFDMRGKRYVLRSRRPRMDNSPEMNCASARRSRSPPFIVAEMSGNHNRSLQRAGHRRRCGQGWAHGLKLRPTPRHDDDRPDEREFHIDDPKSLWAGTSLYKLYGQAYTPWEWHKPIFERARAQGLIPFSTPFDESAVDFLETLEVPCYKIASFENTDLPLIRKAAATGKPLIISTGMATVAELDEAVCAAREAGCKDLVLLKCTSTYPATPENTNIRTIPHMRELFGCEVGLSDHTMAPAW